MAERVRVRCPACRQQHRYTAPVFPCACGTPLALPLLPGGVPVQVRQRSWNDSWVSSAARTAAAVTSGRSRSTAARAGRRSGCRWTTAHWPSPVHRPRRTPMR
jgi:hypothetical protein